MDYTKEDIAFMLAVFAGVIVQDLDIETEDNKSIEEVKLIGLRLLAFLESSPLFDREESIYYTFSRLANKFLESIKDESN